MMTLTYEYGWKVLLNVTQRVRFYYYVTLQQQEVKYMTILHCDNTLV